MTDKIPIARLAERVGSELGTSSWITLDQVRINEFAHCTGDNQWIHVDPERAARESPFGGTIAHGYLTLGLLAPTTFEVMVANVALKQAVNYGLEKCASLPRCTPASERATGSSSPPSKIRAVTASW